MAFIRKSILALAGLSLLTGCTSLAETNADLAITNVTVIDPASSAVLPGRTVLIDQGRIIGVYAADQVRVGDAEIVEGEGRYLMPGLMDMHVHTSIEFLLDNSLQLMLANGVTAVRDMSADCWEPRGEIYMCIDEMRAVAEEIDEGERLGPRLVSLASTFVQSDRTNRLPENHDTLYTPMTREDGTAVVAYLDERGVDLVKVYHAIFPDAFDGVMEEAGRRNLEVSGHVPLLLGSEYASNAGVRTLEHAKEVVTDCSDYTVAYRGAMNAMLRGEEGASWPPESERLNGTVNTFNPERCAALMDVFAANNTYYVPTHGTREMDARASEEEYRADPRLRYVSEFQLADWTQDLDRTAAAPAEITEAYQAFYQRGLEATAIAHARGVKVMMGTDANDTMIIPGFSAHDELARLVEAGLTPMEAIQAATSIPADYLGQSDIYGAIAPGYRADLLLLSSDPTTDIRNTTDIQAVIMGGQYFNRNSLDQILSDVEARVSRQEQ